MKSSRAEIHRKTYKLPELSFEDQQLTDLRIDHRFIQYAEKTQEITQGHVRHTLHQHQRSGCAGCVRGECEQKDHRDTATDQQECGFGLIRTGIE
jgi:hypothetical protein